MAISVFYQRKVTLGNFIFLLSREFLTIFEISQYCRHRTTRIIIKGVNIVERKKYDICIIFLKIVLII